MDENRLSTKGTGSPVVASDPNTGSQVRPIVFTILGTGIFGFILWGISEFLSLRGVVNLAASRIILFLIWTAGTLGACAIVQHTAIIRHRTLAIVLSSIVLGCSLLAADTWAPKPIGRKPDLMVSIVNPTAPQLIIWPLYTVARNVESEPLLGDIDRDDAVSSNSLIINQMKYDWIRQDQHAGPSALLDSRDIQNVVRSGHHIFGYLTVTCPDCERVRLYWIYFTYGKGGWFAEIPRGTVPNPKGIGNSIPSLRGGGIENILENIPQSSKVPIVESPI